MKKKKRNNVYILSTDHVIIKKTPYLEMKHLEKMKLIKTRKRHLIKLFFFWQKRHPFWKNPGNRHLNWEKKKNILNVFFFQLVSMLRIWHGGSWMMRRRANMLLRVFNCKARKKKWSDTLFLVKIFYVDFSPWKKHFFEREGGFPPVHVKKKPLFRNCTLAFSNFWTLPL